MLRVARCGCAGGLLGIWYKLGGMWEFWWDDVDDAIVCQIAKQDNKTETRLESRSRFWLHYYVVFVLGYHS